MLSTSQVCFHADALGLHSERCSGLIRRSQSMDIIYVGLALLFFALSWGLVKLCERL